MREVFIAVNAICLGGIILQIGDVCDMCPTNLPSCCCDLAGDSNHSGEIGIADATFIVAYIFSGGSVPQCLDEADANGSDSINIADAIYLIAYIFTGGPAPVCGTTGM